MPPRKPAKTKAKAPKVDAAPGRSTLLRQTRQLRTQYAEAVEILEAIRSGGVDAVVVGEPGKERVFTLTGAERSYRLLVETVNAGALTVALDGTVLYANRRAGALLNVPLEQLVGRTLEHFIEPEDVPGFRALFAAGAAGEATGEVRLAAAARPRVPVHLALRQLDTGDDRCVCIVITDLTERALIEHALRESEARYRSLFTSSIDAVFLTDDQGQILAANPAACILFRASEADLCRVGRTGLVDPSDPHYAGYLETRRRTGQVRGELRFARPDGSTFDGEASSVLMDEGRGAFVTVRDITERKRVEETHRLREERFAKAFADNSAAMSLTRLGDGVLLDVNETALQLMRYLREQVLGRSVVDLGVWVDPGARARYVEALRTAGRVHGWEVQLADSAGKRLDILLSAELMDLGGEPLILSTFVDVTERRRAEQEARRLRQELAHISRVSLMGELTASLAHELNQPLTAISTNAHAAARYLALPVPRINEVLDTLADVAADALRAGEIIHRLRSLLKKDTTHFRPLDLNDLIEEVVTLTHTDAIIRHRPIALALAADVPQVVGDRVQLQQVLLNLVLNGMDAMAESQGQLVIYTVRDATAVRVGVQDQGHGIPPGQLEKIFTTFFTTKPDGMGMGLAISRSIVEAHGGKIWAENNRDCGATFWFTVPCAPLRSGGQSEVPG